jgi:hypothetical protein
MARSQGFGFWRARKKQIDQNAWASWRSELRHYKGFDSELD